MKRFTMPAEWAPHQGTWFSWPHNPDTWPTQLEATQRALGEAIPEASTAGVHGVDTLLAGMVQSVGNACAAAYSGTSTMYWSTAA